MPICFNQTSPKKAGFYGVRGRVQCSQLSNAHQSNPKPLGPRSNEFWSFGHLTKKIGKGLLICNLQLHLQRNPPKKKKKSLDHVSHECRCRFLRMRWYGFSTLQTGDLARRLKCYTSIIHIMIYVYGCQPKNNGKTPQIIHLFIGFSMKFSPSILGYHYFWKHPYSTGIIRLPVRCQKARLLVIHLPNWVFARLPPQPM